MSHIYDYVCRFPRMYLEERGDGFLVFRGVLENGNPSWTAYEFADGLVAVIDERVMEWNELNATDVVYDFYLPTQMAVVPRLTGDELELIDSGEDFRFWRGTRNIAGSYYSVDSLGYFHVHSFVATSEREGARFVLAWLVMMQAPGDLAGHLLD